MAPSSFSPFLDRLPLPQPALQRSAVRAIFAHLQKAAAHEQPKSALGRVTLTLCLTHSSSAVVDESSQQLVRLVSARPDLLNSAEAVDLLLEGLREVSGGGVCSIVGAIGAVLRVSFTREWVKVAAEKDGLFSGGVGSEGEAAGALAAPAASMTAAWGGDTAAEAHPLLRTLLLRDECQEPVLREVANLLTQARNSGHGRESLMQLRPLLTAVLLHGAGGGLFARRFVEELVGIAASGGCEWGLRILEMLTGHAGLVRTGSGLVQMNSSGVGGGQSAAVLFAALSSDLVTLIQVMLENERQRRERQNGAEKGELSENAPKVPELSRGIQSSALRLVAAVLDTVFDAQRTGRSALLFLNTTTRLLGFLPAAVSVRLLPVWGWLLSNAQIEQEQLLILRSIGRALDLPGHQDRRSAPEINGQDEAATKALVATAVLPIIYLFALPSARLRNGAVNALEKIDKILTSGGTADRQVAAGDASPDLADGPDFSSAFHGLNREAKLVSCLQSLITSLWNGDVKSFPPPPGPASQSSHPIDGTVAWLAALGAHLHSLKAPRNQGTRTPYAMLVRIAFHVGGALMMHSDADVRAHAARVLGFSARLDPVQAAPLLPAVLWWLRREERLAGPDSSPSDGKSRASSSVQLSLLSILPSLGAHPATVGPVLKSLQPMLEPTAQLPLRAVGLRLLFELWTDLDRAFPRLQAALMADVSLPKPAPNLPQTSSNPAVNPATERDGISVANRSDGRSEGAADGIYVANRSRGQSEKGGELEWRIARAACIRGVCKRDAARGVELVLGIQAAIQDANPVVSILGLESLEVLCENDAIDFYTAWRVLRRVFPALPRNADVAQRWAALLAHGALDARAEPAAASEVLSVLLEAAKARGRADDSGRWWRVRKAAVESLSKFPFDAIQGVTSRPLFDYVSLLLAESHDDVREACEALAVKALQYEHSTRRRNVPEARTLSPAASPALKLLQAVPNLFVAGARDKANRAPSAEPPADTTFWGATLYCYRPPAPTPPEESSTNRVALKEYKEALRTWADGVGRIFHEASQNLPGSSPTDQTQLLVSLNAWSRFVPTWLQALATAQSHEKRVSKTEGVLLAANEIWVTLKPMIDEGIPRVAENATLAAAGLCGALRSNASAEIVGSVTSFLAQRLGHVERRDWAERVTAVALGLAAASLPITGRKERSTAVDTLLRAYRNADVSGSGRFAAGLALGLLTQTSGHVDEPATSAPDVTSQQSRNASSVATILGTFLAAVYGAVNDGLAREGLRQLADTWQVELMPRLQGDPADEWAAAGAIAGLSQMCAGGRLPAPLSNPGSISGLLNLLDNLLKEPAKTPEPILTAVLLAVPVMVPLGHRLELVSIPEAEQRLGTLTGFIANPLGVSGRIYTAAALSSGALLDALLSDGCPIGSTTVDRVLESLEVASGDSGLGAAYRVSGLIGLANATGAGFGVLTRRDGGTRPEGILESEERVAQARGAVQKLARSVKEDPDPKVQRQAAWALATLYDSRFGRGLPAREVGIGAENAPPGRSLQSLPEEGAMRPLLTSLLTYAEGSGPANVSGAAAPKQHSASRDGIAYGQANNAREASGSSRGLGVLNGTADGPSETAAVTSETAAAVLRCLANAARLPAFNWGSLFKRLFRAGSPGGTSRDSLRRECLRVAIAHGREVPRLAVFLDDTCQLARMVTLETGLQVLLVRHVAGVLAALPRSGGLRVLGDVRDMVLGGLVGELQAALWQGLGKVWEAVSGAVSGAVKGGVSAEMSGAVSGFSGGVSGDDELLRAAILDIMRSLYGALPVDAGSYRGTALSGKAWSNSKGLADEVGSEWGAAIACLGRMDRAWLLDLVKIPGTTQHGHYVPREAIEVPEDEVSQWRAVIARVLLARNAHLSLAEVKPCRKWLLEQLDWGQNAPHSHRPSADSHPPAGQTEFGRSNLHRNGGFDAAALEGGVEELVAVVAAAGAAEKREWVTETLDWTLLTGRPLQGLTFLALLCNAWLPATCPFLSATPSDALDNLSYTLPTLLDGSDLALDVPAVIQRLVSILRKGGPEVRKVLWPCLVGCREKLSSDAWKFVSDMAVVQNMGTYLNTEHGNSLRRPVGCADHPDP